MLAVRVADRVGKGVRSAPRDALLVDPEFGVLLPLKDEEGNLILDWQGNPQINYENARRPRFILQGKSAAGAFDMAGNVYEWVSDLYDPTYYTQIPRADPIGPNSGEMRVMRGGGYQDTASQLRAAARMWGNEATQADAVGFRCAR